MKKPIYHGKTIIHEIDTAHPVNLRIANQGLVMFEYKNVFSEYLFISIPLFDEVIHSEVREDFKSPYMKKVQERLTVLKMTEEDRVTYYQYLKEAIHSQDVLTAATKKGKAEGEKGMQVRIALNMLQKGLVLVIVSDATGLTPDDITRLSD